jgi:hypothetical protein
MKFTYIPRTRISESDLFKSICNITRLVQTAHNFSTVLLLTLIKFDDDLRTFLLTKMFVMVAYSMFDRISVQLIEAREAGSHTFRTN